METMTPNPPTDPETGADPGPRGPSAAGRALFATGFAVLLLAAFFSRQFTRLQNSGFNDGARTAHRTRTLVKAMPTIASYPGRVAVVVGMSSAGYGVMPDHFDAAMRAQGEELTTFSATVQGLNPDLNRLVARRLRDEFERAHRKPSLILLELPLLATTGASRKRQSTPERVDAVKAQVLNLRLALEELRRSPEDGLRLLVNGYVLDGVTASDTLSWLTPLAHVPPSWAAPVAPHPGDRRPLSERARYFDPDATNSRRDYNLALRGHMNPLMPELRESILGDLKRLASPKQREGFVRSTQGMFGHKDLRIDEALLDDFIATCRDLKELSGGKAVIFISPLDQEWLERSPEAAARAEAAIARVKQETGLTVLDFTASPEFEDADFVDPMHLNNITGAPKLSKLLAEAAKRFL